MIDKRHIISKDKTLLDALKQINGIGRGQLVLFVVDSSQRVLGTLTDGDSRRALINGSGLNVSVEEIMHRNFRFVLKNEPNMVEHLKCLKENLMKLIPVLDYDNKIIDIIDLERCKTKLPIDAVLMAGGKGVRLRPLTEKTPKPLLKVGEKAIIDYNIDRLIEFGVTHISVTVNYLREQIEQHFKEEYRGINVSTVREPEFLGTIGSVKYIKEFYNDTILIMNSDLFTNLNYEDFYLHFKKNDADMSVAAVPYTVSVPFGIFNLEGRDIKGIQEKPVYNYFANAGIYLIKRSMLSEIPDGVCFNATDLIEKLVAQKKKVIRYPLTGFWLDIGSKEEYAKANEFVKHL